MLKKKEIKYLIILFNDTEQDISDRSKNLQK